MSSRRHALAVAVTVVMASLGAQRSARAGAYPWVKLGHDDVRVVADPKLEVGVRMAMIARARHSIDIANYDQRADVDIALPMATALREAANRGVRVRILVSWSTTVLFDYQNHFGELLVDPPTLVPIEYVIVGGPPAQDHGWGMFEGVHEKFCIVDGRALMTTGRGFAEIYLWWLDTAFAVRGALVAQATHAFEATWHQARIVHAPYAGYLGGPRRARAPTYAPTAATQLDDAQTRRRDALIRWLEQTPEPALDHPDSGRLLHHDFLRQMRALSASPAEVDIEDRVRQLADPIVDALVARLATARSVRMAFISTILHPRVLDALLAAHRRGASITLLVNTTAPRLKKTRRPFIPSGSVWAQALADADELLAAGVRLFSFQIKAGSPWLYLHRKLAILDDTVIFGSHNFNIPSSIFFDEASFEVTSPKLAADLAELFDADLRSNGEPLDRGRVRRERDHWKVRALRWMTMPYLEYM